MTNEEKEFIIKINVDKAKNKTTPTFVLITISILTYVAPLMCGRFDFGMIFEVISLLFLIIARYYMNKYDEIRAKRYIICAMIPIGWLLIYDITIFLSSIRNIADLAFLFEDYYFSEILLILYIAMLSAINRDLAKADNPEKYKESTDWFYEKYEGKKDKKVWKWNLNAKNISIEEFENIRKRQSSKKWSI